MTEALRTAVEKKQRSALILWAALTGGMVMYAVIAGVVIPMLDSGTPVDHRALESLVFVVVGLGFLMGAAAIMVYRAANSERGMLKVLAREPSSVDPALNKDELRLLAVAQQISTSSLIAVALCDGIAVLGLVLTLLTYRADYVYVSTGVGVLVSIVIMPRINEAIELAEVLQMRRPG